MYGTEYQQPIQGGNDHNVPCVVCYVSTRVAVMMIPAKTTCPSSWTREYYGYLMAEGYNNRRSTYECVDKDQNSIPGSHGDTNGAISPSLLKLTAMECHVLHMTLPKNLTV